MANTPNFAANAKTWAAMPSVSNTNRDGTTGTYDVLLTAGANGGRVDKLIITAIGNTTGNMIRFFTSVDGGINKRLLFEVVITTVSPNGSNTPAFHYEVDQSNIAELINYAGINSRYVYLPWMLSPGQIIYVTANTVGSGTTDKYNVFAMGGEF